MLSQDAPFCGRQRVIRNSIDRCHSAKAIDAIAVPVPAAVVDKCPLPLLTRYQMVVHEQIDSHAYRADPDMEFPRQIEFIPQNLRAPQR